MAARGLLSSANLSKLFYPISYRSLEGTVVFRPLWPLWVLGKVLNSQQCQKGERADFLRGVKTCSGSTHFLIFLKQSQKCTIRAKVKFIQNPGLALWHSNTCHLGIPQGDQCHPHSLSGDLNGEAGLWFAYTHIRDGYSLHTCSSLLHELEAISLQNIQACKPRATNGLKQFMISGLLRHVLAYTWFL